MKDIAFFKEIPTISMEEFNKNMLTRLIIENKYFFTFRNLKYHSFSTSVLTIKVKDYNKYIRNYNFRIVTTWNKGIPNIYEHFNLKNINWDLLESSLKAS